MSAPNPRTLPAIVVKKIQDVIAFRKSHKPDRDDTVPLYVTGTLEIDPATGKIQDIHLVGRWDKTPDGWTPHYSVIRHTGPNGYYLYGMTPYPDDPPEDVHTNEE